MSRKILLKGLAVLAGTFLLSASFVQAQDAPVPKTGQTASHATGDDGDFEILPNGKVRVDHREFKSLHHYLMSDYFRETGKRCGTKKLSKTKFAPYAKYRVAKELSDCTLSNTIIMEEYWPTSEIVYTIPIVFHIIHKRDGTGNISEQRILDQVDVLNEDFRATLDTLGKNGFDTSIQFELAGTTRTANALWHRDKRELQYKQALGWDQEHYLNVYVNTASGYLGYAYLPQDSAGEVWDGVTVFYGTVGGRNNGFVPYDQGRTLIHEVGHYLGLLHTFEGGCGEGYDAGDLIEDTESESVPHYYCVETLTCDTLDPIHNYMNYTNDLCMDRFTADQGNREVCSLVNYRPSLLIAEPDAYMYVDKIEMSLTQKGKNSYATARITILDDMDNPVSGATVYVEWSGVVNSTGSGTTGSDGMVSIKSKRTKNTGTFTATVTNVEHAAITYDPSGVISGWINNYRNTGG